MANIKPNAATIKCVVFVSVASMLILCSCGRNTSVDPVPTPAAVEFTSHITDLSKIQYIIQPGNSRDTDIEPRSYLSIKTGGGTVEVYAPAAGELYGIGYYVVRADGVPEYALYFKVNNDLNYFFAHLIDVNAKIKALAPSTPNPTSAWVAPTAKTEVSTGELIAYSEGTPQAKTFDFCTFDTSHKNPVANESRYLADDRYLTGTNPYSYYPVSMRSSYLVLSAGPSGVISSTTECRSPCRDVAGTAAGYWYLDSGTDSTYGGKMYLISEVDGSVYWAGAGSRDCEYLTVSKIPLKPELITVGVSNLYIGQIGYLYVKLLSATELGVYYSATDPGSFPATGYKTYSR